VCAGETDRENINLEVLLRKGTVPLNWEDLACLTLSDPALMASSISSFLNRTTLPSLEYSIRQELAPCLRLTIEGSL
jgi:hypothetical protein